MQYDTDFCVVNDKDDCRNISEITFYCFLPFETFFCLIRARNIIFDAGSGETIVIFLIWLLLCSRPQCQLGSPWHSCLVVIKKPHFSHLPVLFTSSSILETLGSFLVLSQLMLFGKQINHAPVWKQGRMMLVMCFFVTVTWIQTPSVVCLKN